MTNLFTSQPLPDLDDMLRSLLLVEEGEHEFEHGADVKELRALFLPVPRHNI